MDDSLSRAFAALADPTRRAILARLNEGEATVSELAEPFALSQPAISKHLRVLEDAGLIGSSQKGQRRPRHVKPNGLAVARDYIESMASFWPERFDRLEALLAAQSDEGTENG